MNNEYQASLDCRNIDGGNWQLVRHTYNAWHSATDNLQGTDEYGIYIDDPMAKSVFSMTFSDLLTVTPSAEMMFSNGDCSQYMITRYKEVSGQTCTGTCNNQPVMKSHLHPDATSQAVFLIRTTGTGTDLHAEDPWLSFSSHATANLIYGEDTFAGNNRWTGSVGAPFLNVWVRPGTPTGDPTRAPTPVPTAVPTSSPTSHCTRFDVDLYLTPCSTKFAAATQDIADLQTSVSNLQTGVSNAGDFIDENMLTGMTNRNAISALTTANNDLETRVDELIASGAKYVPVNAGLVLESEFESESESDVNRDSDNFSSNNNITTGDGDIKNNYNYNMVMFLVGTYVFFFVIIGYLWMKLRRIRQVGNVNGEKTRTYSGVRRASSSSENENDNDNDNDNDTL
jgi:hypothetical protein